MILRLVFLMLAVLPLSLSLQAGWLDTIGEYLYNPKPSAPPMIKVLLMHEQPGVELEVRGKYKLFDPHTKEHISTRFVGKRGYIQAVRDGIKWGEEFPGIHQLVIIPEDRNGGTIINGVEYKGSIYVYDVDGAISIVNLTYIEDYLSSQLTSEFRDPLSEEALAAAAIAARTTAYYQAENPKTNFWDVDGRALNPQLQPNQKQTDAIKRTLQATRYMVMSEGAKQNAQVTPFIADWQNDSKQKSAPQAVFSKITWEQAKEMAQKGKNASQILTIAFPNTKIELIHYLQ